MTVSAHTLIPQQSPTVLFDHLCAHIEGHGVTPDQRDDTKAAFTYLNFHVRLGCEARTLSVTIDAPHTPALYVVKEAVVKMIGEVDASAAKSVRWNKGEFEEVPAGFQVAEVVSREMVFERFQRLVLACPDAGALDHDDIHLKLMVPAHPKRKPVWPSVAANGTTVWPKGKDVLHARYYTIRALDLAANTITIDVAHHGEGRLTEWAKKVKPGAVLGLMGPMAGGLMHEPGRYLLSGDYTALPAIARILAALPGEASGTVIISSHKPGIATAYLPETPLQIIEIDEARFAEEVVSKTRSLPNEPAFTHGWFGGEFATAQAMREVFKKDWGLGKNHQISVSYWRKGVASDGTE